MIAVSRVYFHYVFTIYYNNSVVIVPDFLLREVFRLVICMIDSLIDNNKEFVKSNPCHFGTIFNFDNYLLSAKEDFFYGLRAINQNICERFVNEKDAKARAFTCENLFYSVRSFLIELYRRLTDFKFLYGISSYRRSLCILREHREAIEGLSRQYGFNFT